MSSFGKIYQTFRLNKGFTLKRAANGIVTPQFLGRFEKGQSDISINNLCALLETINVSTEEFFHEYNKEGAAFYLEDFEKQLDSVLLCRDYTLWEKLYQENQERMQQNPDAYYPLQQCLQYYANVLFGENYVIDFDKIIDYLESVESWGKYEFFLATYFSQGISTEKLNLLFQQFFSSKIKTVSFQRYAYDFYLHLCLRLLVEKNFEFARKILEYYMEVQQPELIVQNMAFLFMQKMLDNIMLLENNQEEGFRQCEEDLYFLEKYFGNTYYVERYRKILRQIAEET